MRTERARRRQFAMVTAEWLHFILDTKEGRGCPEIIVTWVAIREWWNPADPRRCFPSLGKIAARAGRVIRGLTWAP